MRITNGMINRQFLSDLASNYSRMTTLLNKVSTGLKFQRPSEAPFDAAKSLEIRKEINILSQKERNINDAKSWLEESEVALSDINSSIGRIKELFIQGRNDALSQSDREGICVEIEQNKQQIISLLNKSYAGKYIFGGFNTRFPPVSENGTQIEYNGVDIETMTAAQASDFKDEKHVYSLSLGISLDVSLTAIDIVGTGSSNLLSTIDELISHFSGGDIDGDLSNQLFGRIQDGFTKNITLITEIGGKSNRVETIDNQMQSTKYLLQKLQADVEGVEQEEAIINFKTSELVYQASLAMGSRLIQSTLLDFLR